MLGAEGSKCWCCFGSKCWCCFGSKYWCCFGVAGIADAVSAFRRGVLYFASLFAPYQANWKISENVYRGNGISYEWQQFSNDQVTCIFHSKKNVHSINSCWHLLWVMVTYDAHILVSRWIRQMMSSVFQVGSYHRHRDGGVRAQVPRSALPGCRRPAC